MLNRLQRLIYRATLDDPTYAFLFTPGPPDEVVSLDCETTGLNPRVDDIIAVAAVVIRANRILISERFEAIVRPEANQGSHSIKVHQLRETDVRQGQHMDDVLPNLLRFIGGRPIVGYYVDFDMRMLNKYVASRLRSKLPNPRIEVSAMYYAAKYKGAAPGTPLDLKFASILSDLGIPSFGQHDALNDALMTAMIYLQLRDLQERGIRLHRARSHQGLDAPIGA